MKLKKEEAKSIIVQKISYLNSCISKGKLVRWPDNCMPLSVYIAPFRWYKAKDDGYKYRDMVMQALTLWEQASKGKIQFQIVNSLNESQINIDWKRVERTSLGHCYFNYDKLGRLFSAEVQIGLSDGIIHSQYMNENEVYHTIVHELGHSIGIQHSPFKSDIMYVPHQYGITSISNKDILTLKWLYTFPCGKSVNEIISNYNFSGVKDLDSLVYMLEREGIKSEFEDVKNSLNKPDEKKLLEDQDLLADINKFNMQLQNIKFPKNP